MSLQSVASGLRGWPGGGAYSGVARSRRAINYNRVASVAQNAGSLAGGESGNEGAAHADRILAKALCPQAFKTDPDGRQDGHVEDSKQRFGNGLRGREIEGHATEAEVYDSGAVNRLVSENSIRIGARHRDAFRFARRGVNALLFGCDWKRGL